LATSSSIDVTAQTRGSEARKWLRTAMPAFAVNDKFVPARSGEVFDIVNPASEEVLGTSARGDKADVDAAVAAARNAFDNGPWPRMSAQERARYLRRFADLLVKHAVELAELDSLNMGMPITMSTNLVSLAAESIHYFAGTAVSVSGHTVPTSSANFYYTLRDPNGVCASIIPWNGPLLQAAWKIGPALAAGNTLVLKPAEHTPFTALRLAELAMEAGFPPGVLNVVTGLGHEAGAALSEHPDVDKLSFTGSTEVGRLILAASVGNFKRVTLELGGKSPNVVFNDADLELAVPVSAQAFTFGTGQVCNAGTRLFVQKDIKDEFIERLLAYTATIKVGDPLDPDTAVGPLSTKEGFDRVQGYFDIGRSEGAVVRTGGARIGDSGYFVQPTVFDVVNNSMRIAQEEIFGPVVSVIPFDDEDDAVLQGNDTTYGLAAGVWTRDVSRAHTVARRLRAGTVWVNTYSQLDPMMPFGGYKQSGAGREFGLDWYHHFTEEKAVYIKL
jgi:acyl-CoA reductase-like NAD-dependent aldehyde dehydrogenase